MEKNKQINLTQSVSKTGKLNKLSSQFQKLSTEEVEKRKQISTKPIDISKRPKKISSFTDEEILDLGFPKRPNESINSSKEEIDSLELKSFEIWLDNVQKRKMEEKEKLGLTDYQVNVPFENNLEVWRQLWRVIEKSNIVAFIIDIRNPILLFPKSCFEYVKTLGKERILIFTKCDLVSEEYKSAWKKYFKQIYSEEICLFISTKPNLTNGEGGIRNRRKLITQNVTKKDKKNFEQQAEYIKKTIIKLAENKNLNEIFCGVIAYPNAAKSSLINFLAGKKLVSVSRSTGHTKHWQTHILHYNDKKITFCDCPGLVFPKLITKNSFETRIIYELFGLFPIPQIREPFSSVAFLLKNIDLERLYNVKYDEDSYGSKKQFSSYGFIGSLADKKKYHISKHGEPDMHKAGLEILRDTVDGYILLSFWPNVQN
eukprot:snap_masked-scaffold_18-processed-gene-0.32-mRNA-1 protein AED:0.37 eAED:0.39 QI:0/-1/0/1/-1/1/1/0/427